MDYCNGSLQCWSKIFRKKWGWGRSWRLKTIWWSQMIELPREEKGTKLTYRGWSPESPEPSSLRTGRGGKDDSNVSHFLTTRLAAFTQLWSNVMRSKYFLSHLILTLSRCLKNIIRWQWETFAPSYNPFFRVVQINILATARITRNITRFSPLYGGSTLSTT